MTWLLQKEAMDKIAASAGMVLPSGFVATEMKTFKAGNAMVIPIDGVLTAESDPFMAFWFGGNPTYSGIINAIEQANADKSVKSIQLLFGSAPGGTVEGLFGAMDAIKNSAKKVTAHVKYMAASAAYALATQAQSITVENRGVMVGSVGVAIDTRVDDGDISITSTEAPDKRPDLTTDEGKASVVKQLDAIHALMAEYIAKGRGISVKDVNENYGRGGMLLADEAKQAGMIDKIKSTATMTAVNDQRKVARMDEKTFDDGMREGARAERERCEAHLTMAKASGDMQSAFEAIAAGESLTDKWVAKHQAAALLKATGAAMARDNVVVTTPVQEPKRDSVEEALCAMSKKGK